MKNSKAFRVAIGGLISAFSLTLLLLTGVFPFGTYAFPVISGVLLISIFLEFGFRWSMLVYGVISILSLFFVADKEAALFFVLLFGYYPIVKSKIEKIKSKAVQYIIKLSIFNISAVAVYYIMMFVFNMDGESFTIFGVNIPMVFLLVGNVVFIIYDFAVTVAAIQYVRKYRNIFFKG